MPQKPQKRPAQIVVSPDELFTAPPSADEELLDAPPPAPKPTATAPPQRSGVSRAADFLPAAIATGASATVGKAPVLSTAMAGVGGAQGEALRQLIELIQDPIPEGPGLPAFKRLVGQAAAIPGAMLREGGLQASAEAGGQGLIRGAAAAGRSLMENAIRPTITMAREFPDIVGTAIRERVPVGAGVLGEKGSAIAKEKLGAAARHVRTLLDRATTDGKTFGASEIAAPVVDLIDDIAKQPLAEADMNKLAGMIDQFLREHKGPLTPVAVKEMKQRAQAFADSVYKAAARGESTTDQTVAAKFQGAVATGAKKSLETIPGVKEGEKKVQELIGLKRALTQSEARRLSLMAEGISGSAAVIGGLMGPNSGLDEKLKSSAAAWLVTRGIMSPRTTSRMALTMTSAQTREFLRAFPRIAMEVVRQGGGARSEPSPRTTPPLE